ncbi:MAG TPA: hypothetical protein VIK91_07715 [Nannocystis sp.]
MVGARRIINSVLHIGLLGGFAVLMWRHPLPSAAPPASASESATASASATAPPVTSTAASDPQSSAPAPAPDPAAPPPVLRVAALGWELLAPGVLANDGLDPGPASEFTAAKIEAHFAAVADMDALQKQLARGGGDDKGADVALLPLPDFVASYERLRGLDPQVFFVIGWSYGRDALARGQQKSLAKLPPRDKITVAARPGQSSALLALFALDLAGVPPDRVEFVGDDKTPAMFVAVDRSLRPKRDRTDARDLLLTTADATELVPLVAIAPAGYIQRNAALLESWARLWLAATARLRSDVPAASRRLSRETGAPEPVDLLDGLGWIRHASLLDNAHLAGLSGRGAVTISELFHRDWTLWRGVGLLSTPVPERLPMTNEIVSRVVLGDPGAPPPADERRPRRGERRSLLVHAVPGDTLDPQALVAEIGFIAGVFARSEIEVRLRKRAGKLGPLLESAAHRFGLDRERLLEGKAHASGPLAYIEVFAAE